MKCPYCNEEIDANTDVCPICGEKLSKVYNYIRASFEYCKKNIHKLVTNKKFVISSAIVIILVLLPSTITSVTHSMNNPDVNAEFVTDESTGGTFFKDNEISYMGYSGYVNYLIDKNGNRINDIKYGACPGFYEYLNNQASFQEGLACVCVKKDNSDKCGFINDKGKFVIEPQFDNASDFSGGAATVQNGKNYGILSKNGNFVSVDCDFMSNFSNGYAKISKNGKDALINTDGKITIPYSNDLRFEYYYENGDYVLGCIGNFEDEDYGTKCAYIRKKDGKRITDYKYTAMGNGGIGSTEFSDGIAIAVVDEKINLINEQGNEILKTNYNMASMSHAFHNGLLKVAKYGDYTSHYGYIDKQGEVVVPLEYTNVCISENGYIFAQKEREVGYINKQCIYKKIDTLPQDVRNSWNYYGFDFDKLCNEYYIEGDKLVKKSDK